MNKLSLSALTLSAILLGACTGDPNGPGGPPVDTTTAPAARTITLCQTRMTYPELIQMLDGNLTVSAGFKADGERASQILTDFVAGFLLNSLDFAALDDWHPAYANGVYHVRNGTSDMDLILMADESFAGYAAGDTLKINMFKPESYVTGIKVTGLPLNPKVAFDEGPLYDLISGSINWGSLSSAPRPSFKLDVTRLSLRIVTNAVWTSSWFGITDTIRVRMATTTLRLSELKQDFRNGRIGFSYDSTFYTSDYLSIDQSIHHSLFEMRPTDSTGKAWSWEGGFQSQVDKVILPNQPLRVFVRGHVSTVHGNGTGYYCDAAFQDSIGATVDDTSGYWGYFKSVRGDSIPYGLVPAH